MSPTFKSLTFRFKNSVEFDSMRKQKKQKSEVPKAVPVHEETDKADLDEAKAGRSIQPKEEAQVTYVPSTPSLQGIPGELRNQIFRLVLVEDKMIRVWKQSHEQPGLLLTNRLIRFETRPIYLRENTFKLDAWNMLLTVPPSYTAHWISRIPSERLYITVRGAADWGNLMTWWQRYCESRLPGLALGQATTEAEMLAQGFVMVDELRGRVGFEAMRPVLEALVQTMKLSERNFDFH